ncbi:MAG: HD domain-containing protein [Actinomycetota bacterium]
MSIDEHPTTGATDHPRASFTSFEESTAEDWAIIAPQLSVTQGFVADRVIGLLRDLEFDHGGFPVNRLEHSLQTATRAEKAGEDDEYVFCALVHDIGDTLSPFNHPDIAAGIVKPFVSEANYFMVKNHGIFQGYYFWHHLGMDRDTREQFRDNEHFEYTEHFCAAYDQTAFDADYVSNPLEHYEPLIRDILRSA